MLQSCSLRRKGTFFEILNLGYNFLQNFNFEDHERINN